MSFADEGRGLEHSTQKDRYPQLQRARRFLFLQYEAPLGAAIAATATFGALKRALPDARITVACGATAYQVLKSDPRIDRLVRTPDPVASPVAAALAFLRAFAFSRFDCIATDSQNGRSRIALLGLLARAGIRLGYTKAKRLYAVALDYRPQHGVIASNLDLVRALGYAVEACEPELYFSRSDAETAAARLRALGVGPEDRIIAFATQFSGGYPQKRGWRAERFASVADRLAREEGRRIAFVGTADEAPAIEALRARMQAPSFSTAGAFDIPGLAAFLARCDLLVTLDSGPLHVARAVGLPAVAIARPWQPPREWLPVGIAGYAVLAKDEVVARSRSDPGFAAPATIDEIGEDEVVAAARRLLQAAAADGRERRLHDHLKP